uniref:Uncharacterized protein n=1 Tax=Plectus sambesii TaxID=2011161 RepID=A0A914WNI6_9BILA
MMMQRSNASLLGRIVRAAYNSRNGRALLHSSVPKSVELTPEQNKVIHASEKKTLAESVIQKFAQHNKESLQKDFDRLEKLIHSPSKLKEYLEDDKQFDRLSHEHQVAVNPEKAAQKAAKKIWKAGTAKAD